MVVQELAAGRGLLSSSKYKRVPEEEGKQPASTCRSRVCKCLCSCLCVGAVAVGAVACGVYMLHGHVSSIDSTSIMRGDDAGPAMSQTPVTTVGGCTCREDSQKCSQGPYVFSACDWCHVVGNCGKRGLFKWWDICKYPHMPAYESQKGTQKMDMLWSHITATDFVGKSLPMLPWMIETTRTAVRVLGYSMRTPFDAHGDVMPLGRPKSIHRQGVVCKFMLDVTAGPYTGVLGRGQHEGIIRMGNAAALGFMSQPGLAIKFPRTGVHSGTLLLLSNASSNAFFSERFTKKRKPPQRLVDLQRFQTASGCVSSTGTSDLCQWDQDGIEASVSIFPFDIIFVATTPVANLVPDTTTANEELLGLLSTIKPDTHLFNVYAKETPLANRVPLGTITTTSKCVQSLWGDEKLFFRHQRMEEDFARKPEWVDAPVDIDGCIASTKPSSDFQCLGQ